MVSLETPICDFGAPAIDFALPGTDGKVWTLDQCRGDKGLLVMFICNHCPYVRAWEDRMKAIQRDYKDKGFVLAAINSNDTVKYPDDDFNAMKQRAEQDWADFLQRAG